MKWQVQVFSFRIAYFRPSPPPRRLINIFHAPSMILVLSPDTRPDSPEYKQLLTHLANLPCISTRVHTEVGSEQTLTEVYLIGNTKALPIEDMQSLPCVERVVRISEEYRVLGRHKNDNRATYFDYNGVRFGQD